VVCTPGFLRTTHFLPDHQLTRWFMSFRVAAVTCSTYFPSRDSNRFRRDLGGSLCQGLREPPTYCLINNLLGGLDPGTPPSCHELPKLHPSVHPSCSVGPIPEHRLTRPSRSTSSCTARCCRLRLEYLATRPYPTHFWWFVCIDHQDLPQTSISLVVRRVYQFHAAQDVESNHQISYEMGIDETCAGQCRLPYCLIPRK
jgi:hypothetical protein